jgi:hypothetical protein
MGTWIVLGAVVVAVLGLLTWIGSRQRRGDRDGVPGGGRERRKATGTTDTYFRDL